MEKQTEVWKIVNLTWTLLVIKQWGLVVVHSTSADSIEEWCKWLFSTPTRWLPDSSKHRTQGGDVESFWKFCISWYMAWGSMLLHLGYVCGDGWLNLCTLITQCSWAACPSPRVQSVWLGSGEAAQTSKSTTDPPWPRDFWIHSGAIRWNVVEIPYFTREEWLTKTPSCTKYIIEKIGMTRTFQTNLYFFGAVPPFIS